MAKLIAIIVIVGAVAYAWHKGWVSQWFDQALDSSVESVKRTQRDATKMRPADPEEKK